tara:strand:- start:7829 stop:8062 length:234 start_codon:yes stop_codon:yes gene_type:complete
MQTYLQEKIKMDNNLEQLYRDFERLSMQHEPLASAGVMMAQALKIYKAMLSEEEFLMVTEHILESRDEITIERPTLN